MPHIIASTGCQFTLPNLSLSFDSDSARGDMPISGLERASMSVSIVTGTESLGFNQRISTKPRAVEKSFPDAVAIPESDLVSSFNFIPKGCHNIEASSRLAWSCGRSFGVSRVAVAKGKKNSPRK